MCNVHIEEEFNTIIILQVDCALSLQFEFTILIQLSIKCFLNWYSWIYIGTVYILLMLNWLIIDCKFLTVFMNLNLIFFENFKYFKTVKNAET